MMELLGVSFLLFVLVALPLGIVTGGVIVSTAIKQWFRLQRARLQLDRDRFERDSEVRRLISELPPWLDLNDPVEVAAWRGAMNETGLLGSKGYKH